MVKSDPKRRKTEDALEKPPPAAEKTTLEEGPRRSFTKGWDDDINYRDALPIISSSGKVVRVRVPEAPKKSADDGEESEGSFGDEDEDGEKVQKRDGLGRLVGNKNKGEAAGDATADGAVKEENDSDSRLTVALVDKLSAQDARVLISQICSDITANPERSVKKKKNSDGKDANAYFAISDLFVIMQCNNIETLHLALLSASLVFIDALPGYRIRQWDKTDSDVTLKKDTKRIKDFELGILAAYQRYIGILNRNITEGLGNAKRKVNLSTDKAKIGLTCLSCVVELIKRLHYFNFRSILLNIVVTRAAQNQKSVNSIPLECLNSLLQMDNDGELSFEIIRMISKTATSFDFNIPAEIIRCLQFAKLGVHADEAGEIRKRAKMEKKKRKRNADEATLGLMESDAVKDKTQKKRLLIDCLQEIVMIYFRIIKQKIGFHLLPTALEGLSKITHLVNIDMVEDLIVILKNILEKGIEVPTLVRVLTVHCAIRTLSGPGQELNADVDIFMKTLKVLLMECPCDFNRWDILLEAIDFSLLKRRELRVQVVRCIVYALMLRIAFLDGKVAKIATSLVHNILIRYQNIRVGLSFMTNNNAEEEESASTRDYAMQGLISADRAKAAKSGGGSLSISGFDSLDDDIGDSSWVFFLQKHNIDPSFHPLINTVANRDIIPTTYQINGAYNVSAVESMDASWKGVASSKQAIIEAKKLMKENNNSNDNGTKKGKKVGYFKTLEKKKTVEKTSGSGFERKEAANSKGFSKKKGFGEGNKGGHSSNSKAGGHGKGNKKNIKSKDFIKGKKGKKH